MNLGLYLADIARFWKCIQSELFSCVVAQRGIT